MSLYWDAATAGRPSVVLVHGEAGVGKTALVRRFADAVADPVVRLFAGGDETERMLAYGVLEQLVAPKERTERLGDFLARRTPPDPLTVGAALVEQLSVSQQHGPVLLVLDDVHWADTPSLHALGFALRRLRSDRVLACLTVRDDNDSRIPAVVQRLVDGPAGARLALRGLGPPELQQLARALGAGRIGPALAERLHEHTGGNPLHARALLLELGNELLSVGADLLPAPRSFAQLALDHVRRLPEPTRELLAAMSVLGLRAPIADAGKVARLDDPVEAVSTAVTAGLLRVTGSERGQLIEFAHPLLRAAVYHDLSPTVRARLHESAVALASTELEAAHHRLAAAVMPDEQLATDAERLARDLSGRGLFASAAELLLRAGVVTPARDDRERRVLDAIEALLLGGDVAEALARAQALDAFVATPRRAYVTGRLALVTGDLASAERLLHEAWTALHDAPDPRLAARVAAVVAVLLANTGRADEALVWADRSLAAEPDVGPATATVRAIRLFALAASGRADEALQIAVDPPPGTELGVGVADDLLGRGVVRLWTDDLAGAHADLHRVTAAVVATGPFDLWAIASFYRADTLYRMGRLAEAAGAAEQILSVVRDADQFWMVGLVASIATWCQSARGAWEAAEAHLDAAREAAAQLGDMANAIWAATAAGRLAQARYDPAAQVAAVRPLLDTAVGQGLDEPGIQPWRELLVEGLVGTGDLYEAEKVLAPLERQAAERQLTSGRAAAARLRASLYAAQGQTEEALEAIAAARAFLSALPSPRLFDAARVEEAHARLLPRGPERDRHFDAAKESYRAIGAEPFAASCAPNDRSPTTGPKASRLTPTESVVARLAASGATNREIAAELVVSAKTVEYHLSNVYAKLGLRSRTELAARMRLS